MMMSQTTPFCEWWIKLILTTCRCGDGDILCVVMVMMMMMILRV